MIYLDHNATTPVLPEVVEVMMPWLTERWGNPSSSYRMGREARKAVEEAREKVAALVGAEPGQVVFTSGATEANNSALHAAVLSGEGRRHLVTSKVEHSAVLAYCEYLERHHGVEVTHLDVDSEGRLDPDAIDEAIRSDTCLVSLMWANNETGVIFPIPQIAEICRKHGVPLHTDAVQAVGKLPVDLLHAGIDCLSLSGHKIGAPKGIGALIVADPSRFKPFLHGGKQENGLRGGTENVAQIIALGMAAEIRQTAGSHGWERIRGLRDQFESELLRLIPTAMVNGGLAERIPNTSNVHIPGMDGDSAVIFLDQKGICVSSGSACMESAIAPSHVVLAMSASHDSANESLRISMGLDAKSDELDKLLEALKEFSAISI